MSRSAGVTRSALIAGELNSLNTPDEAIFYTSGRASNEAAFLYQLFVRQFGTNNLPDCSNMCHESSGSALTETIGVGKGTVTLEDFDPGPGDFRDRPESGYQSPADVVCSAKGEKKRLRDRSYQSAAGSRNDPFQASPGDLEVGWGRGTALADLFLQVRINGDVALLLGMIKELFAEEEKRPGQVLDHQFIEQQTCGLTEFKESLAKVHWGDLIEQCGVPRTKIEDAVRIFVRSERTIFCWAMGLTQHRNAVANIQEIVNLMLLRGQIGKPGAGLCPVRGHSNVQGDRTMGIWERPTDAFLDQPSR